LEMEYGYVRMCIYGGIHLPLVFLPGAYQAKSRGPWCLLAKFNGIKLLWAAWWEATLARIGINCRPCGNIYIGKYI